MNLKKNLHTISHFKWMFIAAQVILIAYCFISLPENLLSIIGIIIFLAGIQLGLESLTDIEKIPVNELKKFSTARFTKTLSLLIFSCIIILIIISTLFLSLKFIFPSKNEVLFNNFFDLGLDCWALILGLLCQLKSVHDKESYVNNLKINPIENPPDEMEISKSS